MAGPRRIDYRSQIRLFALLLFLFLLTILLGSTYLVGQSRGRLDLEMQRALLLAARAAADRLGADTEWREGADPQGLAAGTAAALESLRVETGLARVIVWGRDGRRRVFGPPTHLPPATAIEAVLRDGGPLLSDFFPGEGGGYRRAFTVPVRGEGGRVVGAVTAEVRSDFLGMLHRIGWVMVASYGFGLALALASTVLFMRSALKPYVTLSSAARDLRQIDPGASPVAAGDIEFVTQTFQRMIEVLKAKEEELSRVYAAERERTHHLEQYQEDILGSMTSGVVSCRPDGTIVVFNQTALQTFGYREDEVLGRTFEEVFGPDTPLTRMAQEGLVRQRAHSRLEISVKRRDGATRWMGLNSSVLRDRGGQVLGFTILVTDLTEIVLLRRQLTLKESLATLGEMSAGIAHEFRNSLGAIRGFVRLLQKTQDERAEGAGHVRDILAEIENLEVVLKDFLSFARPISLQLSEASLNALVEEALASCREEIERPGVTLARLLPADPVQIALDPGLVKQVLMNLIRNACEAMPGGGTLTVGAGLVPTRAEEGGGADEEERDAEADGRGWWAELLVADTGSGIPEADRERIFTPFYTTKDHGTGLGLALVQKTVVAHGGRIEVESAEGVGSLFRVLLPHRERRAAPRI